MRKGPHILVIDDHPSTRRGVIQILREGIPGTSFGEACSGAETLAMLGRAGWDAVVLDFGLPDRHGLDLLSEVVRLWPGMPVLVYSAHPEAQLGAQALRAGASGYVTKERAPEDLVDAVRAILAGRTLASPALAAGMAAEPCMEQGRGPLESLSGRELQVLGLTAGGSTGKAIAAELGISQKTVSTYPSRAMRKLGLESTADLVRFALENGLV